MVGVRRVRHSEHSESGQEMASTTNKSEKVVALFAAPEKKESEKKWGKEVMALGYCIFPAILLQAQGRLGVSAQAMVVLLQLAEHWWKVDSKVFPSKETIADRVGLSTKQVQRHIKALEGKKLVRRVERYLPGRGRTTNQYDLSGLVARLKELEPEITKARKLASAATKAGGLTAAMAKSK
jgi:DNA-binding MarR family transcriptional regulator